MPRRKTSDTPKKDSRTDPNATPDESPEGGIVGPIRFFVEDAYGRTEPIDAEDFPALARRAVETGRKANAFLSECRRELILGLFDTPDIRRLSIDQKDRRAFFSAGRRLWKDLLNRDPNPRVPADLPTSYEDLQQLCAFVGLPGDVEITPGLIRMRIAPQLAGRLRWTPKQQPSAQRDERDTPTDPLDALCDDLTRDQQRIIKYLWKRKHAVSWDSLMDAVWSDRPVTDDAVKN